MHYYSSSVYVMLQVQTRPKLLVFCYRKYERHKRLQMLWVMRLQTLNEATKSVIRNIMLIIGSHYKRVITIIGKLKTLFHWTNVS